MTGAHEDIVCQVGMTKRAYEELQKLDPNNNLLKYVEVTSGGFRYITEHLKEFFNKFNEGNDEINLIHLDAKYQKILEAEARRVKSKRKDLAQKTQEE